MSAREEEEHGYEVIIKALTKALTDIKDSLTDSLKPPTFYWNSSEQFEDFCLFIKGMESWYTLQPFWHNRRGTREEQEECQALYGVPTQLHGSPCVSTMQDLPAGRDQDKSW